MAELPNADIVRSWVKACIRDAGHVPPRALAAERASLLIAIGQLTCNPGAYPRSACRDAREALAVLTRDLTSDGYPRAGVAWA
jgi:hypothetical protein